MAKYIEIHDSRGNHLAEVDPQLRNPHAVLRAQDSGFLAVGSQVTDFTLPYPEGPRAISLETWARWFDDSGNPKDRPIVAQRGLLGTTSQLDQTGTTVLVGGGRERVMQGGQGGNLVAASAPDATEVGIFGFDAETGVPRSALSWGRGAQGAPIPVPGVHRQHPVLFGRADNDMFGVLSVETIEPFVYDYELWRLRWLGVYEPTVRLVRSDDGAAWVDDVPLHRFARTSPLPPSQTVDLHDAVIDDDGAVYVLGTSIVWNGWVDGGFWGTQSYVFVTKLIDNGSGMPGTVDPSFPRAIPNSAYGEGTLALALADSTPNDAENTRTQRAERLELGADGRVHLYLSDAPPLDQRRDATNPDPTLPTSRGAIVSFTPAGDDIRVAQLDDVFVDRDNDRSRSALRDQDGDWFIFGNTTSHATTHTVPNGMGGNPIVINTPLVTTAAVSKRDSDGTPSANFDLTLPPSATPTAQVPNPASGYESLAVDVGPERRIVGLLRTSGTPE